MIKYGLISETDERTLEKTIDLIIENAGEMIQVTEIGVYGGDTGRGISEYTRSKGKLCWITGIDNFKDGELMNFSYSMFIKGNSTEVYNQLADNSQDLIFVDGDHSYIGVISDFYAYCDKVKVGGYMAFHDSGNHIQQMKDFQHGDRNNPDAYISVKKALCKIGIYANTLKSETLAGNLEIFKWEVVFDQWDASNPAGGVTVFKKICG